MLKFWLSGTQTNSICIQFHHRGKSPKHIHQTFIVVTIWITTKYLGVSYILNIMQFSDFILCHEKNIDENTICFFIYRSEFLKYVQLFIIIYIINIKFANNIHLFYSFVNFIWINNVLCQGVKLPTWSDTFTFNW